jgi:hypothetical protein
MPFLSLLSYFLGYCWLYPLVNQDIKAWRNYIVPGLLFLFLLFGLFALIVVFVKLSIIRNGFFSRVEQRQLLARMILDNGYYTKKQMKTSSGKSKEKIKFPKIYYQAKKHSVFVSFETAGNKFQEKFETIGGFLETTLHADNVSKIDEKGFVTYELVTDVYAKRISITEMQADKGKVQLMKGLYWHFDKDPHLLLGGGTGGGKSVTRSQLKRLCTVG